MSYKVLAVILARGGSKGIPLKNIREINGHPLIAYTIEAAKGSTLVSDIVVSTDHDKIAEISMQYGAEAPFRRPPQLSNDTALSVDALNHAVLETEKIKGKTYDYVVELPCVSPLRCSTDIDGVLAKLIETGADSVISMVDTGEKHPVRLKKIVDDRIYDFCTEFPEPIRGSRRQDLKPESYIRNGAIYAMTRKCIIDKFSRQGDDSRPYVMPPERSINIDTPLDLKFAEFLIAEGHCSNKPKKSVDSQILQVKHPDPNKPKLLVTAPLHFLPKIKEEIENSCNVTYAFGAGRDQVAELLGDVDGWLCSPCPEYRIDSGLLEYAKKLKVLATPSTGSNHVDKSYCSSKGIEFHCLKDTDFVNQIYASSEFTLAMLMALLRKLPLAFDIAKAGGWREHEDVLRGHEFHELTLGVIGFGRIGSNLCKYVHSLGMKTLAYDTAVKTYPDFVESVSNYEQVLKQSDVVAVCVHLDATTTGMVNASWFQSMKKGAFFINSARGEIVDERALIDALESGQLAGAAVDVISNEFTSIKSEHPMIKYANSHKNLIVTPHIAGLTFESEFKAARYSLNQIFKSLGVM